MGESGKLLTKWGNGETRDAMAALSKGGSGAPPKARSGAQRGSAALFGAALRHRLNAAGIPASPGDPQLSRRARMPSFSDDIVAITAEGS